MTQIDELKKWLNECFRHYEALLEIEGLTPYDRTVWDAYRSVMSRIGEIEENTAKVIAVQNDVSGSETWLTQQENRMRKEMQEQSEYLFGLTHYDWMYRATGDKKYLEQQKAYIEEHKAKFNYR